MFRRVEHDTGALPNSLRHVVGEYGWDHIGATSLRRSLGATLEGRSDVHMHCNGHQLTMSWCDVKTGEQHASALLTGGRRRLVIDHGFAWKEIHRMWRDLLPLDWTWMILAVLPYGIQLHYGGQYYTYIALPKGPSC